MIDLSFTGGSIEITNAAGTASTTITEFSDEGSPIEIDDIEVTGHSINMNGLLIRWRKAAAYVVKVSVIPGSNNDETLTKMLEMAHVRRTGSSGVIVVPISELTLQMVILAPQINGEGGTASSSTGRKWELSEGTIVSGQPGIASDAEGKMQSKTFSFVFERLDPPDNNAYTLNANFQTR